MEIFTRNKYYNLKIPLNYSKANYFHMLRHLIVYYFLATHALGIEYVF